MIDALRSTAWRPMALRAGRKAFDQLGIVGLAGGALVLLALALALYAVPLERQAIETRASADRARALLEQARQSRSLQRPPQQAASLQQWVPALERVNADVQTVFDAARKANVAVVKGEYTLATLDDGSPLRRYEIVLPVKDRYGTIKAFVAEVLNTLPHASLSELHVERNAASVDALDARIRFTLYYRAR